MCVGGVVVVVSMSKVYFRFLFCIVSKESHLRFIRGAFDLWFCCMRHSGAPHFLALTELLRSTVISIICLYSYDNVVDKLFLTDNVVTLFLPDDVFQFDVAFDDGPFGDGAVVNGASVSNVNADDDIDNTDNDDCDVAGVNSVVVDSNLDTEADGTGRDR